MYRYVCIYEKKKRKLNKKEKLFEQNMEFQYKYFLKIFLYNACNMKLFNQAVQFLLHAP